MSQKSSLTLPVDQEDVDDNSIASVNHQGSKQSLLMQTLNTNYKPIQQGWLARKVIEIEDWGVGVASRLTEAEAPCSR